VQLIKEIILTRIKPFVQEDGGDVEFIEFEEDEGVVHLLMKGSCAGCPSSEATLKGGIENMLKHYVAEVTEVRAIDEV
jgi:Fe-S cluster biogenesis protein NfuA